MAVSIFSTRGYVAQPEVQEVAKSTESQQRSWAAATVEREVAACRWLRKRIADTKAARTKAHHLLTDETKAVWRKVSHALESAEGDLVHLLGVHTASLRFAQERLREGGEA